VRRGQRIEGREPRMTGIREASTERRDGLTTGARTGERGSV
jgi:hypothetical protein